VSSPLSKNPRIFSHSATVSESKEIRMNKKELIRFALGVSNGAVLKEIEKMSDAATTFPTPDGGCHPLWVLGHLTIVEGMLPEVLYGEKNPVADWWALFGENSEPVSDPEVYPPFAEVHTRYEQLRERNLQILDSLSEEDLDLPVKAPPKGREHEFATFGSSFLVLALHQCMHRSHVTDARRAAGQIQVAASVAS
jgi:hypothetical protein